MKKKMLLLGVMLSMAFSSKALLVVTISSGTTEGSGLDCTVSAPYWPAQFICCCDINCNYPNGGGYAGFIMSCVKSTGFITSPPPTTPTTYDVDADISLIGSGPFSAAQVDYYSNFKKNGSYTLREDTSYTDAEGNKIIYKAGTYRVRNGKITILASSKQI